MKNLLRRRFLDLRCTLEEPRRIEASRQLFTALDAYCAPFKRIASFSSMRSEINLNAFNLHLAKQGRLLLPRRSKDGSLQYHRVLDLQSLETSQGFLLEPNPALCEQTVLDPQDLILVPGLAFDADHFRLGYGKGHYDKFFARHSTIPTVGLGFREQKYERLLPRDSWDVPVQKLFLF